jgi:hypothetical protein
MPSLPRTLPTPAMPTVVQRMPTLGAAMPSGSAMPTVQALPVQVADTVAYAPVNPPTVTVSRQAEPGPAAPQPATPASPPAGAPPPAGAAPPGGTPEEMVNKLFDPLLRRLKAELLVDRDRRGSLTDLRR